MTTTAEFVAAMRALRQRASLSYPQLERRAKAAGDRLPRSTIAGALTRGRIPREQTIAAFVRACGGDSSAVEQWITARRRVAEADRAADLAEAVGAWLLERWPEGLVDRDDEDLAAAVEEWLATWWEADSDLVGQAADAESHFGSATSFAGGRLAELAALDSSSRWVGVHRRKAGRKRTKLLRKLIGGRVAA
ncbi:hypothetical protein F4553_002091 [Allocatelliglobosispora scoriae]|uniref:XRE family transcriptional regulator n=1 Tax=Allocatelliglobosispora scoriae TaxID=643052 RepID=A0A841BPN7_9ACTN|nr:hypothetical protein [Allocatelliglobosispora scoriae]MBB5868712.1 hypothetical protein [Allocatelliglobosispora scoriae]